MNHFGTNYFTSKRTFSILIATFSILLLPLSSMLFTAEVNWTLMDFLLASLLLFAVGLIIDIVVGKVSNPKNKKYFVIAILVLFLVLWVELAVGIFGSPFAGN